MRMGSWWGMGREEGAHGRLEIVSSLCCAQWSHLGEVPCLEGNAGAHEYLPQSPWIAGRARAKDQHLDI